MSDIKELREEIRLFSLLNAIEYNGEAEVKAVMSRIMGEKPDLRQKAKEVKEIVQEEVKKVNSISLEEQKKELKHKKPSLLEKEEKKEQNLPELPGNKENVRMRFAPNPSGPLHIGHARAIVLNHEYVKRYDGDFILRIEDTDPKRVYPPAYEMIQEDLDYLKIDVDEKIIQGERIQKYYEVAEQLIEQTNAYVCTCEQQEFRELRRKAKACDCRKNSKEANIKKWKKMINGDYEEGEAVLRIKTDINHPDPAIREWPAFRIVDQPHSTYGKKYNTYPLMNFSVAVDDYLLNISHVIRGKDHIPSEKRQKYIFDYMNWEYLEYLHHGTLTIKNIELSTRKIKKGIESGKYNGWNDLRLGTLRALKRRGIQPEAIKEAIKQLGTSEVDAKFSWENLYSENRKIIDEEAERYFFVPNPKKLQIKKSPKKTAKPPIHPDREQKRSIHLEKNPNILLPKKEVKNLKKGDKIRLKNLYNIEITQKSPIEAEYIGNDLSNLDQMKILQWVPQKQNLDMKILKKNQEIKGVIEKNAKNLNENQIIQLERFGFVRIDSEQPIIGCFAHR
ncbi:glutamate--tRNA ligase [archaeon SCG-AAA382B04]|nr:glutamate--tRNA ligase [archaeon SCG-AAA382B04]